jgi:hypothetical protein
VRQDRPGAHPFDEPAMKDYYLSQEPEGRRSHTHWRDDSALDAVKQILDLGEKLLRCPCKECNLCGSERDWLLSFIFSAISAHGASFLRGNVFAQLPQLALHFDDPAWRGAWVSQRQKSKMRRRREWTLLQLRLHQRTQSRETARSRRACPATRSCAQATTLPPTRHFQEVTTRR